MNSFSHSLSYSQSHSRSAMAELGRKRPNSIGVAECEVRNEGLRIWLASERHSDEIKESGQCVPCTSWWLVWSACWQTTAPLHQCSCRNAWILWSCGRQVQDDACELRFRELIKVPYTVVTTYIVSVSTATVNGLCLTSVQLQNHVGGRAVLSCGKYDRYRKTPVRR